MSREVDSRVVEMQFDNANFEKNTKQTISTIDRLMAKLQFKGAEKGFEKLDEAAGEVDFGQMSRSLDTLESKFSTLNIVATTALVNIANKVVDAGEKLVKSLSVDQVLSGWNKYTEKTANVQTIMNATGDSIDTVNGYLNKLMWYSDETSFKFSEMTSALSQMTASGGNIKKIIPMIMGIANATADAGKSGLAFQSTIRNITQSYSAGYLQLQDWKSLNLMGTATKALKQELIDTAVELGTIKKGDVTIASFETSLSKKWANTKVMEKTFEKYASMMEAAYDMTQKDKSLTTSDALKKLTGQYGELAERSALAAQQAKSFSEAIDSTKDAVSSKWMKTFELIFGNKEEATHTWTELANRLYDIFVPPIEAMNDRFASGLDSGWQQLHDKMGDQADAYSAVLQKVALANGIVTEESIEKAGSFGAALKESGASAELLQNGLDSTILTLKDYLAMSDKELDARNVDRDLVQKEYDALTKLNEEFRTGKASMDDFANAINRTSGREHLMQSLWNIMDAIGKVVTPIKEAFDEIFPAADGDRIYSMAERLDLLTKKLIISDEAAEKIKTTFKGVFSVLRVGKDILSGIISGVVRVVSTSKPLAEVLLNAASSAGKFASEITESLHPLETLGNWVTKLVDAVAPLLYSFGSVADKVFEQFAEGAKNVFNEFNPEKMNQFIFGGLGASMLVSVKGFLSSIKTIGSSAKEIIGGIKETIESLGEAVDAWRQAKKAETLMTIAKAVALIAGSLTVLSMVKPERLGPAMLTLVSSMGGLLAVMQAMTMISKNVSGLKFSALSLGMISVSAAVLVLSGALKAISTIGTEKLLASVLALGSVMVELTIVAKVLSADSGRFMKGSVGLIAFASSIRILASSMLAIGSMKWAQMGRGLAGIGGLCAELAVFAATLNKVKFGAGKGAAFLLLATSMNVLVKAFGNFASMEWAEIGKGLAAIAGALTEFTLALNLTKGTLGSAVSLTMMAAAINLLVPAFQGLGALSLGTIGTGLLAIAGAFGVLGGAAVLLSPLTPVIVALSVSLSAVALSLGALLALNSASMFIGNLASSLSLLNSLNFQVFLNGIKSVAWLLVEFIAGVFEGLAKVSSSLVGAIATIIASVCDAIVLAAPSIGNALYTVGTTVIDTVVKLLAYVWDKIEPALNDLWENFKGWIAAHNPFDISNWNVSDKISANSAVVQKKFWQPFQDILDELQHGDSVMAGIYQAFTGAGENSAEGLAEGQLKGKKEVTDASSEVANAAVDAAKTALDEHSPSKVMAEIGQYMTLGLAEGISDQSALARAKNAMQSVASAIRNVFTTFWGIHSPSDLAEEDAKYIVEGAILGVSDADAKERLKEASYDTASAVKDGMTQALDEATVAVQNSMTGLYQAMMSNGGNRLSNNPLYVSRVKQAGEAYDKAVNDNALIPGKNGITKAGNKGTPSSLDKLKEQVQNGVGKLLQPVSSYIDQTMDDLFKNVDDVLPDTGTTTGKTGSKSKASKTGKTLADTLSEAYTKQLKANKTAMSTASAEYELWEATTGDTASVEELLRQKTDSLTKEIELQTDRVAIAKEQYDTLVAKVGKDDDKTKEAYSTLLSEQKTLAELRRDKQDSIFKVLQERYETDSKTAQDEYELWSALYEDSAAVTEKSNRKIEYINKKIAVQAEILTAAEKDYTETKKEFGEKSAATQEAYRQYLEEQTSQQKLINELNQAQLDAFDQQVSYLEKQEKILSNRNSLLLKMYGDGNLSDRESAYNEAVEKYGEGSLEARRASATGTMTAILGVGSALDSMSYSLRKVTNKQLKYDEAVKKFGKNSETALDALADLQDEQYSFVGFADDLADAFEMDDTGKQITMQLGYAISRNWKPIQDGFNAVWDRVKTSFPEAADRLAAAFGLTAKDGFGTVATDLFATIKAAVTGDWGTALSSGLVTVLDFAGSEFGQSLLSTLGNVLYQLPDAFGKLAEGSTVKVLGQVVKVSGEAEGLGSILKNLSGLLGNTSGGTGLLGKAAQGLGKIGSMIGGSGGLLSGIGELGGTLVNVLGSIGPEGWLIGAAIAGGGLLIANWDKVSDFFANFFDWLGNAFSGLWDWISNGFKGLVDIGGDLISGLWNGITGAAGAIWDGVTNFCGGILDSVCDFFGIHSPSTVMAQIGEYLSLGLAQGITESTDDVTASVDDVSKAALSTMEEVVDRVSSVAAEDFDYEPTIRPVVDMTDVQNGADWLNGNLFRESSMALNADRTAGLATNVVRRAEAERNAAWDSSREDGDTMSNRDIVESVQALGEHVDNIAYAVSQMKMSINGKKFVGEIITDVDEQLGKIAKRR